MPDLSDDAIVRAAVSHLDEHYLRAVDPGTLEAVTVTALVRHHRRPWFGLLTVAGVTVAAAASAVVVLAQRPQHAVPPRVAPATSARVTDAPTAVPRPTATPSAAPTATPPAQPTATSVAGVTPLSRAAAQALLDRLIVDGRTRGYDSLFYECEVQANTPRQVTVADCPVTQRLATYVNAHTGPAVPLFVEQYFASGPRLTTVVAEAHDQRIGFDIPLVGGGPPQFHYEVIVVRVGAEWRVDDITCGAGTGTSRYGTICMPGG